MLYRFLEWYPWNGVLLAVLLFQFGRWIGRTYPREPRVSQKTLDRWKREEGRNEFQGPKWNWRYMRERWKK